MTNGRLQALHYVPWSQKNDGYRISLLQTV